MLGGPRQSHRASICHAPRSPAGNTGLQVPWTPSCAGRECCHASISSMALARIQGSTRGMRHSCACAQILATTANGHRRTNSGQPSVKVLRRRIALVASRWVSTSPWQRIQGCHFRLHGVLVGPATTRGCATGKPQFQVLAGPARNRLNSLHIGDLAETQAWRGKTVVFSIAVRRKTFQFLVSYPNLGLQHIDLAQTCMMARDLHRRARSGCLGRRRRLGPLRRNGEFCRCFRGAVNRP